jgi:hypothetical protein
MIVKIVDRKYPLILTLISPGLKNYNNNQRVDSSRLKVSIGDDVTSAAYFNRRNTMLECW